MKILEKIFKNLRKLWKINSFDLKQIKMWKIAKIYYKNKENFEKMENKHRIYLKINVSKIFENYSKS